MLLGLLSGLDLKAKHIIGGEITYRYLRSTDGGNHVYEITMNLFRDCVIPEGEERQTPFDRPTRIGFYENVRGASKPLVRIKRLFYESTDESLVNAFGDSASCPQLPITCIIRGVLSDTVVLPSSSQGFVVAYPRCCRNAPRNLAENSGQTYVAIIPPTQIRNSSPVFDNDPVPLICTEDNTRLPTQSFDPDGDSLAYRLVHPYDGGSVDDPAPSLLGAFRFPPPLVNYAIRGGYGVNQPFGPNSELRIDSETGVLTVIPDPQRTGTFVYAVEVLEYRNGVLIGSIRRDFQLIVAPCQYNPPPTMEVIHKDAADSLIRDELEVIAGDTVKLEFFFADTSSFRIQAEGELTTLDSGASAPVLTVPDRKDTTDKTARLVWPTACALARTTRYFVRFITIDSDCPSRVTTYSFAITVRPPPTPKLMGPDTICPEVDTLAFRVRSQSTDNQPVWSIPGAAWRSPDAPEVRVRWPESPQNEEVAVWNTNANGCRSDTARKRIYTHAVFNDTIAGTQTVCPNNGDIAYEVPDRQGYAYLWNAQNAQIEGDSTGARIEVGFSDPGTSLVSVQRISPDECRDILQKPVIVGYQLETPPIVGPDTVCLNGEAGTFTYRVRPNGKAIYEWHIQPEGSLLSPQQLSEAEVRWQGENQTTEIAVLEKSLDTVNRKICLGDTFRFPVFMQPIPRARLARRPETVCQRDTLLLEATSTWGLQYRWQWPEDAIRLAFEDTVRQQLRLRMDTTGRRRVRVRAIGARGCRGPWIEHPFDIKRTPRPQPILGPDTICAGNREGAVYRLPGAETSVYDWTVEGGRIDALREDAVSITWPDTPGVLHRVLAQEIAASACPGPVNKRSVRLDMPQPRLVRVTTLPEDDRRIELLWKVEGGGGWNNRPMKLQRRSGDSAWGSLATPPGGRRRWVDPQVATGERSYQYRILTVDLCGTEVASPHHASIFLQANRPTADDLSFRWNPYNTWPVAPRYQLLYARGRLTRQPDSILSEQDAPGYDDPLGQQRALQQCFRVRAEAPDAGPEAYSLSNVICEQFSGAVWAPSAFTPNADDFNPAYQLYGYNVHHVHWTIFNRWGEQIFTGQGLDQTWDGQCSDGPCPGGAYLMVVKYVDYRGPQSFEQVVHLLR